MTRSAVGMVRRVRPGVVGAALALGMVGCGSAAVVQGPTSTPAGSPGPPPAGSGSATLDWTPVTQNTDGTVLTDLAGYKVYYGTSRTTLNGWSWYRIRP